LDLAAGNTQDADGGGDDALCAMTAVELRRLLGSGEVSAREVTEAHLLRTERTNPDINAIVTLTAESALQLADAADAAFARGEELGPLHGLPLAHKDLQVTRGVRTTFGSTLYADHVPDIDSIAVERIAAAGGISLGKTNTPEFGTGSQTYNAVFGATRNPYDRDKTAGGSSGGAAAALAAGMVALADGSDMGGSLRNPANFCSVVGFRPSSGVIPVWPESMGWSSLPVDGPMARTVADCALLLGVMAGHDPRSPIAIPGDGTEFHGDLARDLRGLRVAWSRNLGGLPVEPAVTEVLDRDGRTALVELGCAVRDVEPDFSGAEDAFRTLRAWSYATAFGPRLDEQRATLKPDLVANVEEGLRLTADDLGRAELVRTQLWHRMNALFQDVDVVAMPVSQVVPFDVDIPWPTEINGIVQQTYLDWMRSAYWVSATGLPAISVPCGFTDDGLPVGLQLMGRPRGDLELLQIAHGFEQATLAHRRTPVFG
jgi:amidase